MIAIIVIVVVFFLGKFIYDTYLTDNTDRRYNEYLQNRSHQKPVESNDGDLLLFGKSQDQVLIKMQSNPAYMFKEIKPLEAGNRMIIFEGIFSSDYKVLFWLTNNKVKQVSMEGTSESMNDLINALKANSTKYSENTYLDRKGYVFKIDRTSYTTRINVTESLSNK